MREELHAALRRAKLPRTEEAYTPLRDEIARAISQAISDRRGTIARRLSAAVESLAGVDAAIRARAGEEALAAIVEDEFDPAPDDLVLFSLIDARSQLALEAGALQHQLDETKAPAGRSRKLQPEQERLLNAIATAWVRHVDSELPLPRRDPEPDSPFLRFLDAVLAHVWGESRPPKKAVLSFLHDHVRPSLRSASE